jgi:hypothetical protein
MKEIVNSFINGQFTQMVEQIEEYGVYDFASELRNETGLSYSQRCDMMRIYLMKTNR